MSYVYSKPKPKVVICISITLGQFQIGLYALHVHATFKVFFPFFLLLTLPAY